MCERSRVGYAIGFSRNGVTGRKIADLLERARLQFIQTQQKARLFDDVYYAAATWDAPRRLVMKGLSCSNFIANQFRLLLSQAAYILMLTIRLTSP